MDQKPTKLGVSPFYVGLVIFGIAVAARIAWVLMLKNDFYWGDERAYAEIARHLARGDGYVSDSYRANPGLPVYLSLVFRFFGENLLLARLGQCVAGGLTCALLYRIGARLAGEPAGIASGFLLAVYPPHIYLSGVFYAECLLVFWGALAVYLAVCSIGGGPNVWLALLTGVALGLAALTRSVLAVWIPCVCVAWLYEAKDAWRKRLFLCAMLLIGSAATILPWTVRNYFVFRRFVPVSSAFGTLLWQANNPLSTGAHSDWYLSPKSMMETGLMEQLPAEKRLIVEQQYKDVNKRVEELTSTLGDHYLASDQVLAPLAIHYIGLHPGQTLTRSLRRLRSLFSAFSATQTTNEHTRSSYKNVAAICFYPLLILGVCGMWFGLAKRRTLALLYLAVVPLVIVLTLVPGTQTRYRLPLDPYLIVFASLALVRLYYFIRLTGEQRKS